MKPPSEDDDGEEWGGISDTEADKTIKTDKFEETPTPAADKEQLAGVLKKNNTKQDDKKQKLKEKRDAKKKEQKEQKAKENKPKEAEPAQDPNLKSSLSFATLLEQAEDEDNDGVDVSEWDKLNLSPELLTGLSKMKFSMPSAIQKASIPAIMEGHDVIGKASTGSGKTLAFSIPILEYYLDKRGKIDQAERSKRPPMALILSPTRELAVQLAKHIGELVANSPNTDTRIALLTGGLSIQKQQRQLAHADIVVGTPGRVWEILSTGTGIIRKMQSVRFLVIDEADRLLSEGHFKEVEEILGALDRKEQGDFPDMDEEAEKESEEPNVRQTLVFSATFDRELQTKLAGKGRWSGGDMMDQKQSMEYLLKKLNFREEKPRFIDVNQGKQMAEGLKEGIVECPAMEKVRHPTDTVLTPILITTSGSLSLLASPLSPETPHSCLHQFHCRRPAPYPAAPNPSTPGTWSPLLYGTKGPTPLRRALLITCRRP